MKLLILITISIASLNVFSAELGEDQKGECAFASQTSKREAKPRVAVETESIKPESTSNISK